MVAALQTLPLPGPVHSPWQVLFVALLPAIHKCVLFAFRHLPQQEQEELVQESLANACVAYARLAGQGRSQRAFPTALARFAVAQVRVGRRVGTALNSRDVLSPAAQRKRHFVVHRLDQLRVQRDEWLAAVIEDHCTPVLDQVCFRIDFPQWLGSLSSRDREIARALANSYSTAEVARRYALSPGRVSQLRREFHQSWLWFHHEGDLAQPKGHRSAA
jgi:hypothetical protein